MQGSFNNSPGRGGVPFGSRHPGKKWSRIRAALLIPILSLVASTILVDTPAAGGCADASTVAARAGAALILACRDSSSVPRIAALSDELRQFGVTVVGAVLNGAGRS